VELIGKREISKEKQDEYVAVILSSIERLNKLVEGLLAFSGRWTEIPLYTDLNDLLKKTLELYRNQLNEKRIRVEENFSPDLPMCETHPDKMQMALGNIIQNALQQTPEDGEIEVATRYDFREPDKLSIEVSNTGSYIQPDDLERVFNPFFTTKADGTGLGLSLSLYVIQKQRGDIKVRSNPAAGTTFTVSLPVKQT
jgi:signal transduction histidine kinase